MTGCSKYVVFKQAPV